MWRLKPNVDCKNSPVMRISDIMHLSEVTHITTCPAHLVNTLTCVRCSRVVPGAPGTGILCWVGNQGCLVTRLSTWPTSVTLSYLWPGSHTYNKINNEWAYLRYQLKNFVVWVFTVGLGQMPANTEENWSKLNSFSLSLHNQTMINDYPKYCSI